VVSIPLSLMRTAILQCVLISVIVTVMVVLKICLENGAVRQKMTYVIFFWMPIYLI